MPLPLYRLLLVEDDHANARPVGSMLAELEVPPMAVRRVTSVDGAVDLLGEEPFDIVFLDLDLPNGDGAEALERMLSFGFPVPVVVLTALGDDEVGLRAVASGAQDYLVKDDVHASVLARVMRYAVARQRVLTQEKRQISEQTASALRAATTETREAREALAIQRVIAPAATNDVIEGVYEGAIEGWTRVLELRDHDTMGHSRRVADMAIALGRRLGLGDDELDPLRRGALLHDIGKIAVPDAILRKQGPLDAGERSVMERHTEFARDLLEPIEFLRNAIDVPYAHHERWDGSGYPRGLVGDDIPLAARIFAVVDVYDALTRDRPYRSAWSRDAALAYIKRAAGRLFDPKVVAAFTTLTV